MSVHFDELNFEILPLGHQRSGPIGHIVMHYVTVAFILTSADAHSLPGYQKMHPTYGYTYIFSGKHCYELLFPKEI